LPFHHTGLFPNLDVQDRMEQPVLVYVYLLNLWHLGYALG
jgi:hypothetical protein